MLAAHGHESVVYASEGVDRDTWLGCSEYVGLIDDNLRQRWFGAPRWPENEVFDHWNSEESCWIEWNDLAAKAILERIEPGDGVGVIAGRCQAALADHFPDNPIVEWGVGYPGVLDRSFRAFESHAWRSFVSGQASSDDVRWFDTVIPNGYGLDEFVPPQDHDGYLLFVGRPTERKGLAVVRELAQRFPVKCAGQSDPQIPDAEYVGLVRGDEKARLFAGAVAVLAPTIYHPPFEGVVVEAQLSGVPAITTDHGAFVELVDHGRDGWRCHTFAEFCDAAEQCAFLGIHNRRDIARRARLRWSLDAVSIQYDQWLRRLELLADGGWYG